MQNKFRLNTIISVAIILLFFGGIFSLSSSKSSKGVKINYVNIDQSKGVEREEPTLEPTPISCPFSFAKDDTFELFFTKCSDAILPDGTTDGMNRVADEVGIRKLDGTSVRKFQNMNYWFYAVGTPSEDATLSHDITGTYVFLDEGTSTTHGLRVFSLKNGNSTSMSYSSGMVTKNGYFVYNSPTGIENLHPDYERPEGNQVIAVRLSDFKQSILFDSIPGADYYLDLNLSNKIIGTQVPTSDQDYLLIKKFDSESVEARHGNPKEEVIKVPIASLK